MFSSTFSRLLGTVSYKESPTTISLEGLPGNTFGTDITKTWGTSKLASNMFKQLTRSKVMFNKFFTVDVLYILEQLLEAPKARGVNKRALKKAIELLKEESWLKAIEDESIPDILDFSQLKRFKKTPLDHQREFLERYNHIVPRYNLNGYMLGAKPGAGKTMNSLYLAACLKADVTVVVAPNNAIFEVWKKTLETELHKVPKVWVSGEGKPLVGGMEYYVFHYEALGGITELVKHVGGKNVVVILDESHNFNEEKSNRTKSFIDFCSKSKTKNVLWMSGTPLKALGYELIPLLRTIDPYFDDDAEQRFKKIFGKSASKGLDILKNRIGYVTFKVEKSQFSKQAPIEQTIKVKVPNAQRFTLDVVRKDMKDFIEERMNYYKKNQKEFRGYYDEGVAIYKATIKTDAEKKAFAYYQQCISVISRGYDPVTMGDQVMYTNKFEKEKIIPLLKQPLRNNFKSAKSVVKYLALKVAGEALGTVLGKRRTECNVALIEHATLPDLIDNAIKKTVIFTSNVDVVVQATQYLTRSGYKPLPVYADTNKDLTNIVRKFGNEEDANPCIATYKSLSTAVPLTMANNVILLNQPFREYEREQAISRADRIGQDTQVYVWSILLDTEDVPNVSTRAADIVQWSREQVAAIMGVDIGLENIATEEFGGYKTSISIEDIIEYIEGGDEKLIEVTTAIPQSLGSMSW